MPSLIWIFVLAPFCVFLSLDAAWNSVPALPTHGADHESTSVEGASEKGKIKDPSTLRKSTEIMEKKLYGMITTDFEDIGSQKLALDKIHIEKLEERALNAAKRAGRKGFTQHDLLKELLNLFNEGNFFEWVEELLCQRCRVPMEMLRLEVPNEDEKKYKASNVEIWKCKSESCRIVSRFPRYNHPGKVIETQRGRCGEWAQAFTLCCRALGFEARLVIDWSDHCWTEVYSHTLKQFIHCDPCENSFNDPLMYENKGTSISYVIAVSASEMRDVSRRYTNNYESVLRRRTRCPEQWLEALLHTINGRLSASLRADERRIVHERWQRDLQRLRVGSDCESTSASAAARVSAPSSSVRQPFRCLNLGKKWKKIRILSRKYVPTTNQ